MFTIVYEINGFCSSYVLRSHSTGFHQKDNTQIIEIFWHLTLTRPPY